jgi:hypothetical protein
MGFIGGYVVIKSDSPKGGPIWENDDEGLLVDILSAYTPHFIVGALSAAFDVSDLAKLAAELDDLILYLRANDAA